MKSRKRKVTAILAALLLVIGLMPLCSGEAHAASSSYVYVSTHIKDSSESFGGGQVMISGSPVYGGHDYFAANGYHCEFSVGQEVVIKAQPAEGYHFVEWQRGNYDSYGYSNFQAESYSTNAEQPLSAMDDNYYFFAIFEADPPTPRAVTFDTRGGSAVGPQTVPDGEKAARPDDPVKGDPGWAYFEGWYYDEALTRPFDFNTPILCDMTLYAGWYYGLSVGTYNKTKGQSDHACGKFGVYNADWDYWENDYAGNCNFTRREGTTTLKAYPNNGYRFAGWYEGKYVGDDDQDMEPVDLNDPATLLCTTPEYSFTLSAYTCVIPVFEEAPVVNFVDIGTVWTDLDPVHEVPFTAEINPNEEGLADFIEIKDEKWTCGESVISKSAPGVAAAGNTYSYSVVINARGDNVFDPDNGFRFVFGGTEYAFETLMVEFSADLKTVHIGRFVPDQTVEKAANPTTVKSRTASVRYSRLKKRTQYLKVGKVLTIKKKQGRLTYKLTGVTKSKFRKYFRVNAKTGKVTVKKGLRKGTYTVKVRITAPETAVYKKLTKNVSFKVKVK